MGIREAAFLGLPVVNIGSRQAGRDRGRNVVDVDYDVPQIASAITKAMSIPKWESDPYIWRWLGRPADS